MTEHCQSGGSTAVGAREGPGEARAALRGARVPSGGCPKVLHGGEVARHGPRVRFHGDQLSPCVRHAPRAGRTHPGTRSPRDPVRGQMEPARHRPHRAPWRRAGATASPRRSAPPTSRPSSAPCRRGPPRASATRRPNSRTSTANGPGGVPREGATAARPDRRGPTGPGAARRRSCAACGGLPGSSWRSKAAVRLRTRSGYRVCAPTGTLVGPGAWRPLRSAAPASFEPAEAPSSASRPRHAMRATPSQSSRREPARRSRAEPAHGAGRPRCSACDDGRSTGAGTATGRTCWAPDEGPRPCRAPATASPTSGGLARPTAARAPGPPGWTSARARRPSAGCSRPACCARSAAGSTSA